MSKKEVYTYQDALTKAMSYCAYQERGQHEVREKLKTFQITEEEREHVITELIQQNFLNEERFAKAFVNGKVNIKRWGWKKIEIELKKRQVSSYCIQKAFKQIDQEQYFQNVLYWIRRKKQGSLNDYKNLQKIKQFLYSKGFEMNTIEMGIEDVKLESHG